MQRRAVAVYVALFVVVGAAAGTLVATADTPEVSFDDPDYVLTAGETFEHEGQTYTVAEISEQEEESDHGPATVFVAGTLEWNETVQQSATWSNGSTVTYDDEEWDVVIEGDDPSTVTLRGQINRTAILQNDSDADNETVTSEGEEYVAVRDEDGDKTLVPADEYFPAPEEREFAEGETIDYEDHEATIDEVTSSEAVLAWETVETRSMEVTEGDNATLSGTDYVVHFEGADTLVLSSNHDAYQAELAEIDTFEQHVTGLRRITGILTMGTLILIGLAFAPSRY